MIRLYYCNPCQLLDEKGVKFYFKTTAKEFTGVEGKVSGVTLTDGTKLPIDLCVMGVGEYFEWVQYGSGYWVRNGSGYNMKVGT